MARTPPGRGAGIGPYERPVGGSGQPIGPRDGGPGPPVSRTAGGRSYGVGEAGWLPVAGQPLRSARSHSLFIAAIEGSGMPLGQAVAHSPVRVQPPKPSSSIVATMSRTRDSRSGEP